MPRTLSPEVLAEKDKDFNRPVELYQIFLDEDTIYLAMYPEDVEFFDENGNPQTYYAAALSRQEIATNTDTKLDSTEVQIDNVNQEMSAYIAYTNFVGRKMNIWKVFLDQLSNPDDYVSIFNGYMDEPRINQNSMSVTVVSSLDTLDQVLPRRTFQTKCNWQFAGEECGVNADTAAESCDKTYNGGHGCTYWNNTKYYGGFLAIPKIRNVREA